MTGDRGASHRSGTALRIAEHTQLEARAADVAPPVGSVRAASARGRVHGLLDPDSFVEFDLLARHRSADFDALLNRPHGDGVVTGCGTIDGRTVYVYSQEFSVFGGSLGEVHGRKIVKVMDLALRNGCPIIGISDGAGGRIQEGVCAQALYGEIFRRNVAASGIVPQISLILGPCAGGAAYSPALTDFVVMVDGLSHMFLTGPKVIESHTGETVGLDALGSGSVHAGRTGNAQYLADDETDALWFVRELLGYLPSNNLDEPPAAPTCAGGTLDGCMPDELNALVPDSSARPYDMRAVLEQVVDDGQLLEIHERFAPNVLTAFARVEGRSVGVVANQPLHLAGALDIDASEKAARFVRQCDAFNIPIVTFVDVPGFVPGTDQEWNGIVRRGAKLIYAYAEATVPLVTIIVRKAYGGAYVVMGSKHLGGDLNFAWPTAQIAVMGAQSAVDIIHRKKLAEAADSQTRQTSRSRLIDEYEQIMLSPYKAAERGYIDGVIEPATTRRCVADALRALRTKRQEVPWRKHGNIPL